MTTSDKVTLHGALVAIQKSFSRLSEMSADDEDTNPEKAKALIIGNVDFNLQFRANIMDSDKVILDDKGSVTMNYSGTIATDIRVEPKEQEETDGE